MRANIAVPPPGSAATAVRASGARILGHCDQHAVAQAIEILDKHY